MSTQSPFGSPQPPVPEVPVESTDGGRSKVVIIAVASGVLALGVLGGAAALVIGGGDDVDPLVGAAGPGVEATAEPSAEVTGEPVAAPLPTAAVQGRNIFTALIGEGGSGEASAVPEEVTSTQAPAELPTVAPTTLPAPRVTETVVVPGPTSTVTTTVPGPTATVSSFAYDLTVVSVVDPASDTTSATFRVNGVDQLVADDQVFSDVLTYNGYDVAGEQVLFQFGSTMYSMPVGTRVGLGGS